MPAAAVPNPAAGWPPEASHARAATIVPPARISACASSRWKLYLASMLPEKHMRLRICTSADINAVLRFALTVGVSCALFPGAWVAPETQGIVGARRNP